MNNSPQLLDCNNTTDQQGNSDAGLQAIAETAEPKRYRSMQECMDTLPGHAWREVAERLAHWTDDRLVNRSDVYRAYKLPNNRYLGESITYTKPYLEEAREFGSLTRGIVEGHYRCCDPVELIGLHAVAFDNTARWFVINVNQKDANGAILAEANANAAFGWYEDLQLLGFRPLLLDANGAGGYHLLVCLSESISSRRVHAFVTDFVQNYADYGLTQAPEVYPSEPEVNPHWPYGSWWRLPGRHHTRDHWTRVWNGQRWLNNQEAIEAILSLEGDSPDLIPGFERLASAAERHGDVASFARFLLEEHIDPEVVAEVCLLWDEVHNQPPSDEGHVRQVVRDLVQ